MTDTKQPEALRLANAIEGLATKAWTREEVAAELRRLHARIAELEQEVAHTDSLLGKANALARIRAHRIAELKAQLEAIGAGGVSGPPAAQAEGWAGYEVQPLYTHPSPPKGMAGWKHDCAALLMNDVELWIQSCPHCGKPRDTAPPTSAEGVEHG